MEVFLAESRSKDWGEELDDWRWEDIKEEGRKERRESSWEEKSVQTDERGEERERIAKLVKDFPNLMKEDGLLPVPPELRKRNQGEPKEGWSREMGSIIRVSEVMRDPRLAGSVVKHPCCGTTCAVLSAPIQNMMPTFPPGVKRI